MYGAILNIKHETFSGPRKCFIFRANEALLFSAKGKAAKAQQLFKGQDDSQTSGNVIE